MQVQKVWRTVVCFEHSKVLSAEMRVAFFTRQDGKEKGEVGVIGIQQIQLAEIGGIAARHGCKIGIELVVRLDVEIAVCISEDAGELSDELVCLCLRGRIDHNRQREVA